MSLWKVGMGPFRLLFRDSIRLWVGVSSLEKVGVFKGVTGNCELSPGNPEARPCSLSKWNGETLLKCFTLFRKKFQKVLQLNGLFSDK